MKAILLIRVSTKEQDLIQQREKVIEAAKRDGFKDDDLILIEDKESAVKLSEEERNGLNLLKTNILSDSSISTVYSYEISRISRQAKIVFSIRDFLIQHRIQLIILNPYFKMLKDDFTLSETSNIFFGIFSSMAENEGFIRNQRMRRGKERKKALGLHYTGRIPLGYTTNKMKEYVIDEATSGIVKKIFDLYVNKDMSLRKTAKQLRDEGFFFYNTLHTTERIICEVIHRRYYTGEVKGYPQIISKEIFDKAQEIKKRRTIDSPRTNVKALLKGLLIDKNNQHTLQSNTGLGSYHSSSYLGCSVKMSIIEPIIWDYVIRIHKRFYSNEYEQSIKEITQMIQLVYRKKRTYIDRLYELEERKDRLEERIILGKISSKKADEIENEILKQIESAKKEYYRIQDDIERYEMMQNQILDESNKQIDYDLLNIDERIEMTKKVISKIFLHRGNKKELYIEIHNNYNDEIENITLIRKWRNYVIKK